MGPASRGELLALPIPGTSPSPPFSHDKLPDSAQRSSLCCWSEVTLTTLRVSEVTTSVGTSSIRAAGLGKSESSAAPACWVCLFTLFLYHCRSRTPGYRALATLFCACLHKNYCSESQRESGCLSAIHHYCATEISP